MRREKKDEENNSRGHIRLQGVDEEDFNFRNSLNIHKANCSLSELVMKTTRTEVRGVNKN